jgi:hypothetical protein
MRGRLVALSALAAALAACSALRDDDDQTAPDCVELSCVEANQAYRYRPTREARQPVQVATPAAEELPESAYDPIESAPTHTVTFSADLETVELVSIEDERRLRGTQQARSAQRIAYDLDAFAGGQFVVQFDDAKLEAGITLFGSGVPITSSTRGLLAPEQSNK